MESSQKYSIVHSWDSGLGSHLQEEIGNILLVYAGSSYAPKATDRRSFSGDLVMLCGAAWLSRAQICISLSSTDAEYISVSEVLGETIFSRGMFQFIRPVEEVGPTLLRTTRGPISC